MYRVRAGTLEVLLVHPGGPFFHRKDAGVWSIPKGEIDEGEEELAAAQREFEEETGVVPTGPFLPLGEIRQRSGKRVHAWAFAGDCDPARCKSNEFHMEWPPGSGHVRGFPEVDRTEFFDLARAREKMNAGQVPLLERLLTSVAP